MQTNILKTLLSEKSYKKYTLCLKTPLNVIFSNQCLHRKENVHLSPCYLHFTKLKKITITIMKKMVKYQTRQ